MLSPCFIPKSVFFGQSTQRMPVPTVWETTCFYYKRRASILYTNTTLNRLGFGATASGDFNFQNNESEDMFVHKAILLVINSIPILTLSLAFSPLIYSAESSVGVVRIKKRALYAKRSQTTAFCSCESRTHFVKTCLQGF